MTNLQSTLDEVSKLDKEATPGEWRLAQSGNIGGPISREVVAVDYDRVICHDGIGFGDGYFIYRSRSLLPRLAEALRVADEALCSIQGFETLASFGSLGKKRFHEVNGSYHHAQEARAEIERILGEV